MEWSKVEWKQKQGHEEDEMRNLIIIYIYASRRRIYLFIRNVNDNNNMNENAKGLKAEVEWQVASLFICTYIHIQYFKSYK